MIEVAKEGKAISRRTVLKIGALATAALAVGMPPGKLVKAASESDAGVEANQIGFIYDQSKCIGCRACVSACRSANKWDKNEPGAQWRRLLSSNKSNGKVYLSISCNHCQDPACVKVCPVRAYQKRAKDGIVIHDPEKCIGCKYCLYACPYHAPQYSHETGRISKCHFCYARQDEGKDPACVSACPQKALGYGKLLELKKVQGAVSQLPGLPAEHVTRPSWVIIPK